MVRRVRAPDRARASGTGVGVTAGRRLPRHRATTAHLCSAYPFAAEAGCGSAGVYLGTDVLTGGAGFSYDPFEAYRAGLVTNPNVLFEIGRASCRERVCQYV